MIKFVLFLIIGSVILFFILRYRNVQSRKRPKLKPAIKRMQDFEEYVHQTLFPLSAYQCIHKRGFYSSSASWVSITDFPGLVLKPAESNGKFYVKTKYHPNIESNQIVDWVGSNERFLKFKRVNDTNPVYLVLGVGGDPQKPETLYLIPLSQLTSHEVELNAITRFIVKQKPVEQSFFIN